MSMYALNDSSTVFFVFTQAGLDATYVMQCEIMGVRCAKTSILNHGGNTAPSNSKPPSVIARQVLNLAESYTREKSPDCGLANVAGENLIQRTQLLQLIHRELAQLGRVSKRYVPTENVDLTRYKALSANVDAELRANPKIRRWYYANATASAVARASLKHRDIDIYTLFSDRTWRVWWENLLTKLDLARFCKKSCRPAPVIGEQRSRVPTPCENEGSGQT